MNAGLSIFFLLNLSKKNQNESLPIELCRLLNLVVKPLPEAIFPSVGEDKNVDTEAGCGTEGVAGWGASASLSIEKEKQIPGHLIGPCPVLASDRLFRGRAEPGSQQPA